LIENINNHLYVNLNNIDFVDNMTVTIITDRKLYCYNQTDRKM